MKNLIKTVAVFIGLMATFSLQAQTTKTNSQTTKDQKVNKSSTNVNGQKKSTVNKSSSNTTNKNSITKNKQGENPSMQAPNNAKNDSLRNQDRDRLLNDNYKDSRSGTNDFSGARDTTRQFNKNSKVKDHIKRDTI